MTEFIPPDDDNPFPDEDGGNGHHEAAKPQPSRRLHLPDDVANNAFLLDRLRELNAYPQTDSGNGEAFVHLYGAQFRHDHRRGKDGAWLHWDGNRWSLDERCAYWQHGLLLARQRHMAADLIENEDMRKKALVWGRKSESRAGVTNTLWAARAMPPVSSLTTDFDKNAWLLSVANGVLDLRTGTLRNARPDDMITRGSCVTFDPLATAPRWLVFLDEIFASNKDLIGFVQRVAGYCLTGDTTEQCLFICWGQGANGKSVLLNTLRAMAGTLGADTAFTTFEVTRSDNSNDLAGLVNARLVTSKESSEGKQLNEARVKAVTGHEPVTCRFLYNEFFTYVPTWKVLLAVNHKPEIRGTDNGIWRRIRLLPFTVSFQGKREDKRLEDKLMAELPGILNWALQGCLEWQALGDLCAPAVVTDATREYRAESDAVGRFLDDCTCAQEIGGARATELYQAFVKWTKANGEEGTSNVRFARSMKERGLATTHDMYGSFYPGLGITHAPMPEREPVMEQERF
jgi:putative DNA primase/helicase